MKARYVIKRILNALFILFVVVSLNFVLPRLVFSDPAEPYFRGVPDNDFALREKIRQEYGLDGSIFTQYTVYLKNVARLNFGNSEVYKQPVFEVMFSKMPWSMILSITGMVISLSLGIIFGTKAAKNRSGWQDKALLSSATVSTAIPTFWVGLIFLMLFAFSIPIFPYSGAMTTGYELTFNKNVFIIAVLSCIIVTAVLYYIFKKVSVLFIGPMAGLVLAALISVPLADTLDIAYHAALPLFVICIGSIISYALMVRNSMSAVVNEDYILTARAKGLSPKNVLYNHTMRNALLPMVTSIGMSMAGIFGGSVLIERIFSWPGMGGLLIEAQSAGDFLLAQAIMFFYSLVTIIANLLTDFVYHKLDPRIKVA